MLGEQSKKEQPQQTKCRGYYTSGHWTHFWTLDKHTQHSIHTLHMQKEREIASERDTYLYWLCTQWITTLRCSCCFSPASILHRQTYWTTAWWGWSRDKRKPRCQNDFPLKRKHKGFNFFCLVRNSKHCSLFCCYSRKWKKLGRNEREREREKYIYM